MAKPKSSSWKVVLSLIFAGIVLVGISSLFAPSHSPAAIGPAQVPSSTGQLSNNNYYINTNGNTVHSPAHSDKVPVGASARCRDGSYSFSVNRRGTCSHHGGVATWY